MTARKTSTRKTSTRKAKAKPTPRVHAIKPDKPRLTATPVRYSDEIADRILRRIANGESLRAICDDKGYPDRGTVFRWVNDDPEFAAKYAHAREWQQEAYAEDGVYIADTEPDPTRARNRILSRQWYAEKLKPKKFGNKVELGGGGRDGAIIVQLTEQDMKLA